MHIWDKVTKMMTVTLPVLYRHSTFECEFEQDPPAVGGGGVVVTELCVN